LPSDPNKSWTLQSTFTRPTQQILEGDNPPKGGKT
jgi:hypothetical protein